MFYYQPSNRDIAGMLRTWPLYPTTRCWRPGKASVENLSAAWKLRWDPSEAFDPTGDEEGQGSKLTYSTFLTPLYISSSKVPLQRPAFTLLLLLFTSIYSFSVQVPDLAQNSGCVTFPTFWDAPCREDSKEAEDQISLAPDEGPRMPYQLLGSLEVPRISVTGSFLKVGRQKKVSCFPFMKDPFPSWYSYLFS